jgi:hypothetical protein
MLPMDHAFSGVKSGHFTRFGAAKVGMLRQIQHFFSQSFYQNDCFAGICALFSALWRPFQVLQKVL